MRKQSSSTSKLKLAATASSAENDYEQHSNDTSESIANESIRK